jgi:hypothetical protein
LIKHQSPRGKENKEGRNGDDGDVVVVDYCSKSSRRLALAHEHPDTRCFTNLASFERGRRSTLSFEKREAAGDTCSVRVRIKNVTAGLKRQQH